MHSSVDGCLGYFHCGAFMNNAAVNIYVQFFAQMYLFTSLGYMQEYSCWIVWYLFVHLFEELPKCFPKWLHHVTVLPAISLPPNYIIIVFMNECNHSRGCEGPQHCDFGLHFLND